MEKRSSQAKSLKILLGLEIKHALNTTKDLAEIVKDSIPAPARRTGGNPAKRTFQALRIEVNQELVHTGAGYSSRRYQRLTIGGRLVVMSYQSLEDRIVKEPFYAGKQI